MAAKANMATQVSQGDDYYAVEDQEKACEKRHFMRDYYYYAICAL